MQTEILYRPSYSMARVSLAPYEEIRVEAGSMVSMSDGVSIETHMQGGLFKSLARSFLGGESFFINTYKAPAQGGEVGVAPTLPGDVAVLDLADEPLMLQSGSYIASANTVEVETKWGGARTFFASEGLIMLRVLGHGPVLISNDGAIHEVNLKPGERFTIDTGHLVAFSEGVDFRVRRIGGIKSTLFSGEGLVVDLTGPGRVLMQTRSVDAFLSWLIPKLPKQSSSSHR